MHHPQPADREEARRVREVGRPLLGDPRPEALEAPRGMEMSSTSSVIAIAKTPSLKASILPLSKRSAMPQHSSRRAALLAGRLSPALTARPM